MMNEKYVVKIEDCDYIGDDYGDLVQYSPEHFVIEKKRLEKDFFDMLDNLYIEKDKFDQLNDIKTFLSYLKTTDKAEKVVNDIIEFFIDECYCETISTPKSMNDEKLDKFFNHSIEEFENYTGAKNLHDLAEYNFFEYFFDLDGLDLVEYFERFDIYVGTAGYSNWAQYVTIGEDYGFCSDLWDGYNFYDVFVYNADENGVLNPCDLICENYIKSDNNLEAVLCDVINTNNATIYLWNNDSAAYFEKYNKIDVEEKIEYRALV